MTDWRPMQTAPKDRTAVRLFCDTGDGSKLFEAIGNYVDLGAWADKSGRLLSPKKWKPLEEDGREAR